MFHRIPSPGSWERPFLRLLPGGLNLARPCGRPTRSGMMGQNPQNPKSFPKGFRVTGSGPRNPSADKEWLLFLVLCNLSGRGGGYSWESS